MMYSHEKDKISYSLIILLMVFSQNTMLFSPLAEGNAGKIRTLVYLMVLAGLLIKTVIRKWVSKSLLLSFVLFAGTVILSMIIHVDNGAEYWLIVMLISLFIIMNYNISDFSRKYSLLMRMLCILFLLGYFLLSMKPDLVLSPTWLRLEQNGIVFEHSSMLYYYRMGIVPIRAYGIYREPGVYQMYVILAMLICLYSKKKFMADFLVYSLAVLTTHSTTGYICLLLIYTVLVLKMLALKDKRAVVILTGIIAIGAVAAPRLINSILNKFTATGISAHSWMSRFASFATNIYLWLKNPLFGIGMNGILENFSDVTQNVFGLNAGGVAITDDTNSILIFFAAYGLIPGLIFCIGIWKGIRKIEKSILCDLMVMGIFICLFAGEQVNNTCYPYILIFSGLGAKGLSATKKMPYKRMFRNRIGKEHDR